MFNWLTTLLTGQNVDALQASNDQLNAETAAWQAQQRASGKWTDAQYQTAQNDLAKTIADNQDLQGQVNDAFIEGAKDGLKNDVTFTNNTLSGIVKGIWDAIPLSVWIILAVVLFVYVGGLGFVRRRIARAG